MIGPDLKGPFSGSLPKKKKNIPLRWEVTAAASQQIFEAHGPGVPPLPELRVRHPASLAGSDAAGGLEF